MRDLLSAEELCNENPVLEDTGEVNEESAPMSAANDFSLIFLGGPL